MSKGQGFTLMEMVVVILIMGAVIAISFPNYSVPTEQARALTAQNNLLAIYSAQQNYNNNYGSYCTATQGNVANCGDTLAHINTNLSLNIQDNGMYSYACQSSASPPTCTATRTSIGSSNTIVLTLNSAINLSGSGTGNNPACNLTSIWCPAL